MTLVASQLWARVAVAGEGSAAAMSPRFDERRPLLLPPRLQLGLARPRGLLPLTLALARVRKTRGDETTL